ncbi:MAG: ZIP family metal transporter [Flavobacteriales bacterium]|nr:ZIP family metal transporter [Flavobacteriales bacterium]
MTDYLQIMILFGSTLLGGLAVFLFNNPEESKLKLLISFSGSYLLAICLLHMIPEIFEDGEEGIGIYILAGFFLQVLLEFFSGGIEHGHVHVHKSNINVIPLALILSLCVHAFTEGMPLSGLEEQRNTLILGIVLHKMPIAFVLMVFLTKAQLSKGKSVAVLLLFALMAPVGVLIGSSILEVVSMEKLLAIVVGIFLHVSTTILFESTDNHRFNIQKIIIIIFGASLAFIHI